MEPVRIKLYGLVWMTRRRYLAQVITAALLAVALLSFWWLRWPSVRAMMERSPTPVTERVVAFVTIMPWLILAGALVQGIEAWYVLRLFARKEAERSQAQPQGEIRK
jgi:hypothetical protein